MGAEYTEPSSKAAPLACVGCMRYRHSSDAIDFKHRCHSMKNNELACWKNVQLGGTICNDREEKGVDDEEPVRVWGMLHPTVESCDDWLRFAMIEAFDDKNDAGKKRLVTSLCVLRSALLEVDELKQRLKLKPATRSKRKVTL